MSEGSSDCREDRWKEGKKDSRLFDADKDDGGSGEGGGWDEESADAAGQDFGQGGCQNAVDSCVALADTQWKERHYEQLAKERRGRRPACFDQGPEPEAG